MGFVFMYSGGGIIATTICRLSNSHTSGFLCYNFCLVKEKRLSSIENYKVGAQLRLFLCPIPLFCGANQSLHAQPRTIPTYAYNGEFYLPKRMCLAVVARHRRKNYRKTQHMTTRPTIGAARVYRFPSFHEIQSAVEKGIHLCSRNKAREEDLF